MGLRRLLKFCHTLGAVGLMGAMACILAMMSLSPHPTTTEGSAALLKGMAAIAGWIFFPSLAVTLIAGLIGIAVTPAYHEAGWVWAKAATGILLFEGGLLYVQGPITAAAKAGAAVPSGDPAALAKLSGAEGATLWVLLGVCAANVALGIWRPRLRLHVA